MVQTTEMTHKQKVKMYKKLKKRELIEMLIAANEVIKAIPPTIVYNPTPITSPLPYKGWEVTCNGTNSTIYNEKAISDTYRIASF